MTTTSLAPYVCDEAEARDLTEQPLTYEEARALTDQLKVSLGRRSRREGITRADNRWHVVYRAYDADGRLLYVGISLDFAGRASAHKRGQWWFQATRLEITHWPNRDSALREEARLIAAFRPPYNRCGGQS